MRGLSLVLGVTCAAAALSPPPPAAAATCAPVQVVAVRGTSEKGTIGTLEPLAAKLRAAVPGATVTGLRYPATSDWLRSANAGVDSLTTLLATASKTCPQQRFVLVGYSQGAWVIGDALAADGVGTSKVAPDVGTRIAAVVMYGDPRFVAGEPFDEGTHRDGVNGLIPRPTGTLDGYAARIRSFCDGDDPICQSGSSGRGHSGYWPKDDRAAVAFVLSKLQEPLAGPVATPTPSPTPVATPTPAPEPPRRNWFQRFVRWVNPFD